MYDWANSAFSTTVMAGFVPILFKQYWSAGVDASEIVVPARASPIRFRVLPSRCVAPALGAIADAGGNRASAFCFACTAVGVVATACSGVGGGAWTTAAVVYVIAVVGFSASMIFYDALLMDVSTPETSDCVSAVRLRAGLLGRRAALRDQHRSCTAMPE